MDVDALAPRVDFHRPPWYLRYGISGPLCCTKKNNNHLQVAVISASKRDPSNHMTSHHIPSYHHTTPYHIIHIISYHILSHHITSYHITSSYILQLPDFKDTDVWQLRTSILKTDAWFTKCDLTGAWILTLRLIAGIPCSTRTSNRDIGNAIVFSFLLVK